jgi:hypothetical protein
MEDARAYIGHIDEELGFERALPMYMTGILGNYIFLRLFGINFSKVFLMG